MENICDVCRAELIEKGLKVLGETEYRVLRCDKCRKQFMKRKEG